MRTRIGTSVGDFFSRFPTEKQCLTHIWDCKISSGYSCPDCGECTGWSYIKGTKKSRHRCGKHVSILRGTIFYRSNLSLVAGFYAILLFSNSSVGVRSNFLRKQLGIGGKSAHRLCNRIRLHMAHFRDEGRLGGPGKVVSVDEVLLKNSRDYAERGMTRRIVLGFFCDGKVRIGMIENRKGSTLLSAIAKNVAHGSTIVTDDWIGYKNLPSLGFEHTRVNHSKGMFVDRSGRSTCDIDSFWAVLRRTLRLYHQVGNENLWLFLAEAEFRFNFRSMHRSIFDELIGCWRNIDEQDLIRVRALFDWRLVGGEAS